MLVRMYIHVPVPQSEDLRLTPGTSIVCNLYFTKVQTLGAICQCYELKTIVLLIECR